MIDSNGLQPGTAVSYVSLSGGQGTVALVGGRPCARFWTQPYIHCLFNPDSTPWEVAVPVLIYRLKKSAEKLVIYPTSGKDRLK